MKVKVKVLGAAMTRFGRHPAGSVRSLAECAARAALDEAGVPSGRVRMVVFGNAAGGVLDGQEMIRDRYAEKARRYMQQSGATVEDLARVAVKNRRHASQ